MQNNKVGLEKKKKSRELMPKHDKNDVMAQHKDNWGQKVMSQHRKNHVVAHFKKFEFHEYI